MNQHSDCHYVDGDHGNPYEYTDQKAKFQDQSYAYRLCWYSVLIVIHRTLLSQLFKGILLAMTATTLFMLSMSFAAQGYSWDSAIIIVSFRHPTATDFGIY